VTFFYIFKLKITHVHVCVELVKIDLGPKIQKGQYLGNWIVIYFVRILKLQVGDN